jgi:hypothetical protein
MQDLANGLHCSQFFQNLICGRGHPKNSNITPFGLFEYLFTPFGLSNVAQRFQCMMERTVDNLEVMFACMDDSRCKTPPHQSGATPTSSPQAELSIATDASDSHNQQKSGDQ